MKTTFCGHADLVDILSSGRPELVAVAATLLKLEYVPDNEEEEEETEFDQSGKKITIITDPYVEPSVEISSAPLAEVPFWCTEEYCLREKIDSDDEGTITPLKPVNWTKRPQQSPPFNPLAQWNQLLPRLRQPDLNKKPGKRIDLQVAVNRLSRGEFLYRMPKKEQQRWGTSVQIIMDCSRHLTPYWYDQTIVCRHLAQLFPRHALECGVYYEGFEQPLLFSKQPGEREYRVPPPGSLVIVLGDLGHLTIGGYNRKVWQRLGQQLIENGCRPLALFPSQRVEKTFELFEPWSLVNWETGSNKDSEYNIDVEAQVQRLLNLVSPAIRVEPGFLRSVRRLIDGDASLESFFWQHPAVIGKSVAAATIDPIKAKEFRLNFEKEDEDLKIAVLRLLRHWRAKLPQEIWFEEIKSLTPASQQLCNQILDLQHDLQDAANYISNLGQTSDKIESGGTMQAWFCRMEQRLPTNTWTDSKLNPALNRLWQQCHRDDPPDIKLKPPPGFDPKDIPANSSQRLKTWQLYQHGGKLQAIPPFTEEAGDSKRHGSFLGRIRSRNGEISVATLEANDWDRNAFWKNGTAPVWASDWDVDDYGFWVEFKLKQKNRAPVVQRMRWIKPGVFLMGSPQVEPERWENEGPQHRVEISRGFWLFDTACTQSLWVAVMGDNPSHFKGGDKPVEMVSWKDVQKFIEALNQKLPGLELTLPSEAQWEYACRAGTETPFSFGQAIHPEQANYDGNLPYAGGEKGLYREETVDVIYFQPNSWGLYQMHGNVDEWCLDGLREYLNTSEKDPLVTLENGAGRVVRGGSWDSFARYVRSAYRGGYEPDYRYYVLGFRCARVHEGAEPAESLQDRPRQRRLAAGPPRAAGLIRVNGDSVQDSCRWPSAEHLLIQSDTEELILSTLNRPEWAKAVGRDRFGLWAGFEMAGSHGRVHQRLRWIPPGRFRMGSPLDEAGRIDREGPQHEVIISRGFWLFDTPCTQALWQAVMGDHPSYFKSPNRPVEQVSWDEVQKFIGKVNEQVSGLNLVLPSEAQWEYACRGGMDKATYAGNLEILGENNAPVLDRIAWYGGNSGVEFDLEEGRDSSDWPEKQYPHQKAGTREVAGKDPNPWGLYDMLGNVWEWCMDGQREYQDATEKDPLGTLEDGAGRVVRGGSWDNVARFVRSACRLENEPDDRNVILGFRCARVHDQEQE